MMKKFFLLTFVTFVLAACSEDKVHIPVPVTGIELDLEETTLVSGKTLQLLATVSPADATDPVLVWKSDDTSVVTVSDKGLVTAVATGTTDVWVECDEFKDFCRITVEELETISFEPGEGMLGLDGKAVTLGMISVVSGSTTDTYDNVCWAKEYAVSAQLTDKYDQIYFAGPYFTTASGNVSFSSYYCDCMIYGSQLDTWGGFVLSSNVNKTVSPSEAGTSNQFEAYADGGADGSNTFAACYDLQSAGMAMNGKDISWPQIDLKTPCLAASISLANCVWTYNYFKGGEGDSYIVKITGKLAGAETGSVECALVNGVTKVADWQYFDLSALGRVDCLVFKVLSSSPAAPFYFCADEIVFKK